MRMPSYRRQGGPIGYRPKCPCCQRPKRNLLFATSDTVALSNVNLTRSNEADGTSQQVLRNVDFTAEAGQLHMLVGPNGCGKSTLLRLIGGLLNRDSGEVTVNGPCAFVFQNPDHQVVMPTVAAEVAFGTGQQELTQEELIPRVKSALEKVNMWDLAESSTSTLSGGQKQRLAIAGALAQGPPPPQVLLLDELTTFLDADDAQSVLTAVKDLISLDPSVAAIWVTHRLEELPKADQVTYMEAGEVVMSGSPGRILRHLRSLGATI